MPPASIQQLQIVQSEIASSLDGTTVPTLASYLSTKADNLYAFSGNYLKSEQRINQRKSLSSEELGTKKEMVSLEMQPQQ